VVLAFVLLAIGLNSFELASGLRIRSTETVERFEEALQNRQQNDRVWLSGELLGRIVSIVTALAIVLFFVSQVRKESRATTAILIFVLGMMVILFAVLPDRSNELPPEIVEGSGEMIGQGALGATEELPEEDAVDVSVERQRTQDPVVWIVTAVAAIGLIVVLRPSISFRKRQDTGGVTEQTEIAEQAARGAREAGGSTEVLSVVLRCYREMLQVYQTTRFSGKPQSLTPREFAGKLCDAGVDPNHAWDLTTLFERARYGEVTLDESEEAHAVACLTGISEALRR
jgi:hypothetical protein